MGAVSFWRLTNSKERFTIAYIDAPICHYVTQTPSGALSKPTRSDFWTRSHPGMKAAGYAAASLIGLVLAPALFIAMDHDDVVRWSNQIFDLVSR
jgi:hypothetical protein